VDTDDERVDDPTPCLYQGLPQGAPVPARCEMEPETISWWKKVWNNPTVPADTKKEVDESLFVGADNEKLFSTPEFPVALITATSFTKTKEINLRNVAAKIMASLRPSLHALEAVAAEAKTLETKLEKKEAVDKILCSNLALIRLHISLGISSLIDTAAYVNTLRRNNVIDSVDKSLGHFLRKMDGNSEHLFGVPFQDAIKAAKEDAKLAETVKGQPRGKKSFRGGRGGRSTGPDRSAAKKKPNKKTKAGAVAAAKREKEAESV